MKRRKLAICITAYNEQNNIVSLLDKIIKEKFPPRVTKRIFVYTGGSTDNTPKYVEGYQENFPKLLSHLKAQKRLGKVVGINTLIKCARGYEIIFFLDGDITFTPGTLRLIYMYLVQHPSLKAVSPLFLPYDRGLNGIQKMIASLYRKSRIHVAKYKFSRHLSGRFFVIKSDVLVPVPLDCPYEDFYLNLQLPYKLIDICDEAKVYYWRPTRILDFIRYNLKLGRVLGILKNNYPVLWQEQKKRIDLVDYAVFDLARYKFWEFFSSLNFSEKVVFSFIRTISTLSMFAGFLFYKKGGNPWNPIASTKIKFQEDSG